MTLKSLTITTVIIIGVSINLDTMVVQPMAEPKQSRIITADKICTKDMQTSICYPIKLEPLEEVKEEVVEPEPTQVPPSNYAKEGEVERLIRERFGDEADKALAVAKCESNFRPSAIGDRNLNPASYGIFQIRAFPGRPSPEELLDAEYNIDYAYHLWQTQGWAPWTCARKLGF